MKACHLFAKAILEELVHLGLDYFCLAPGSRNTPFTHALAKNPLTRDFIHFDERGLAFHALGYGKALQKPAPLFITSGSSLANLFPAVVEAFQAQVPLLIFSADRPYDLRDCTSNQTIDQVKFFHQYVHWHQDLPLFDLNASFDFIASTIDYATRLSLKGPVHLNCQFKEPFLQKPSLEQIKRYTDWSSKKRAHTLFYSSQKHLENPPEMDPSKKGILICGRGVSKKEFEMISALSKKINWPIFPDVLSEGRFNNDSQTIPYYDLILKNQPCSEIEAVIQFKDAFTSKVLLQEMSKQKLISYQIVSPLENRLDPTHQKAQIYETSLENFCNSLKIIAPPIDSSWLNAWKEKNEAVEHYLNQPFFETFLSEPFCIREILKNASNQALFYLAASMPIRDALCFGKSSFPLKIYSNRGASGIDGNLATAFGLSQALDEPISVIIGDLAFLHDLNSLAQIKDLKHPPTIFLINNYGGGIFSFLPVKNEVEHFKRYFQTEHAYSFESIAKQFELHYLQPKTLGDLKKELLDSHKRPKLIELQTNSDQNLSLHQQIDQDLKQCFLSENMETLKIPS